MSLLPTDDGAFARNARRPRVRVAVASALMLALFALAGCAPPDTSVAVYDGYPAAPAFPVVVYEAHWEAVTVQGPIFPGTSSPSSPAVPTSGTTAYVLLAPGWDPATSPTPSALVVLQSNADFEVALDGHLTIPVGDATFAGDCASASFLTQSQADFITQLVFPDAFAGKHYDAATCATTPVGDAGDQ